MPLLVAFGLLVIAGLLLAFRVMPGRFGSRGGLRVTSKWAAMPGSSLAVVDAAGPLVVAEPLSSGGCEVKVLTHEGTFGSLLRNPEPVRMVVSAGGTVWILGENQLCGVDMSGKTRWTERGTVAAMGAGGDVLAYVRRSGTPADARQLWAAEDLVVVDLKKNKPLFTAKREGRRAVGVCVIPGRDGVKVAVGSLLAGYPLRSTVEFYGPEGKEGEWTGAEGLVRYIKADATGESVFAATRNLVVRLDCSGKAMWKYYVSGDVLGLCAANDGGVAVAVGSGAGEAPLVNWMKKDHLVGLGADGVQVWSQPTKAAIRSICPGPAVAGRSTIAVSTGGGVELFGWDGDRLAFAALDGGARLARTVDGHLYVLDGNWVLCGLTPENEKR